MNALPTIERAIHRHLRRNSPADAAVLYARQANMSDCKYIIVEGITDTDFEVAGTGFEPHTDSYYQDFIFRILVGTEKHYEQPEQARAEVFALARRVLAELTKSPALVNPDNTDEEVVYSWIRAHRMNKTKDWAMVKCEEREILLSIRLYTEDLL